MGGIRLVQVLDPQIPETLTLTPYSTLKEDDASILTRSEAGLWAASKLAQKPSPPANALQLLWLLQKDKIDIKDFPTVAEIQDKSKNSHILKGLACFQRIWLLKSVRVIISLVCRKRPIECSSSLVLALIHAYGAGIFLHHSIIQLSSLCYA